MVNDVTGLSAISQTIAITKELRSIDDKIVVAEFKLKIAEIVDKLLDAKQSLVDAQEREAALHREISQLKEKSKLRSKLEDKNGRLFELDKSRNPTGEPYCNHCYVKEERLFRLVSTFQYSGPCYKCSNCGFISEILEKPRAKGQLETGYDILDPYGK